MNINWFKSKLFKVYKIFLSPPKRWTYPSRSQVLVYENTGIDILAPYLQKYSVEIISVSGEFVNVPCLCRAMLSLSFWRGNPLEAYEDAFIVQVSPCVVLSTIDNNVGFYKISGRFPSIKTIFLQSGTRSEVSDVFSHLVANTDFHVDYMLVHNFVIGDYYRKFVSGRSCAVGSFKNNSVSISDRRKVGTILFVSQYCPKPINQIPLFHGPDGSPIYWDQFFEPEILVLKVLGQFCIENGLHLRISGRSWERNGEEERFFALNLVGVLFEFVPRSSPYSSYDLLEEAEIVVFIDSTLGYEAIGRGIKTAGFSCRGIRSTNFGWPAELPDNGPFWTNSADETEFRRVLDFLMTTTDEIWEKARKIYADQLMEFDPGNTSFTALLNELTDQA